MTVRYVGEVFYKMVEDALEYNGMAGTGRKIAFRGLPVKIGSLLPPTDRNTRKAL